MPYPARKERSRTQEEPETAPVKRQDDTGIIPFAMTILLIGVFSWLYAHGIPILADTIGFADVRLFRYLVYGVLVVTILSSLFWFFGLITPSKWKQGGRNT